MINAIPSESSVIVEPLSVTQNGTHSATSGKAYSPVTAGALSPDDSDIAYISGINNESMLMFGFLYSQSTVPVNILGYNNGIITIENVDTFEQGFLYAFIPDFDFDENIATMEEVKEYFGVI